MPPRSYALSQTVIISNRRSCESKPAVVAVIDIPSSATTLTVACVGKVYGGVRRKQPTRDPLSIR